MFTGHRLKAPQWNQRQAYVTTGLSTMVKAMVVSQEEMEQIMSGSLWCDIDDEETNVKGQIGHPFSVKDPNRRHYEETQTVDVPTGNSYGRATYQAREEVTSEMDICGYHMDKRNPWKPVSKEDLPALEEKNADWQAGYEAATNHEMYLRGKVE